MKITVDVECTPEEARRAVGLPDLTPLHDHYVARLREAMDGNIRPEAIEAMIRSWAPMGEASMAVWRSLIEQGTGSGGGGGGAR